MATGCAVGLAAYPGGHAEAVTLPSVASVAATVPATFFAETHLTCLARSELAGSTATVRAFCYGSQSPSPLPPPPPPPYDDGVFLPLVGSFDSSTGVTLLPVLGCTQLSPALAVTVVLGITVSGTTGAGSVIIGIDTTAPLDCADATLSLGDLTLTGLAANHDQDGDGCTDWDELDPAPPAQDPFNPTDCAGGSGVGGLTELSQRGADGSVAASHGDDGSWLLVASMATLILATSTLIATLVWRRLRR